MRIGNWSEMFMKFLLVPQFNISPIDYSKRVKNISQKIIFYDIYWERERRKVKWLQWYLNWIFFYNNLSSLYTNVIKYYQKISKI